MTNDYPSDEVGISDNELDAVLSAASTKADTVLTQKLQLQAGLNAIIGDATDYQVPSVDTVSAGKGGPAQVLATDMSSSSPPSVNAVLADIDKTIDELSRISHEWCIRNHSERRSCVDATIQNLQMLHSGLDTSAVGRQEARDLLDKAARHLNEAATSFARRKIPSRGPKVGEISLMLFAMVWLCVIFTDPDLQSAVLIPIVLTVLLRNVRSIRRVKRSMPRVVDHLQEIAAEVERLFDDSDDRARTR